MAHTISVLADSLGLSTDTVRYYERLGLLLQHPSAAVLATGSTTRMPVERLEFIKGGQRMGLRLGDIKELLDLRDRGECPCGHTQTLVQRRLAEVDAEIKQLTAMRGQLRELKKRRARRFSVTLLTEEWSCNVGFQKGGANDDDLS